MISINGLCVWDFDLVIDFIFIELDVNYWFMLCNGVLIYCKFFVDLVMVNVMVMVGDKVWLVVVVLGDISLFGFEVFGDWMVL